MMAEKLYLKPNVLVEPLFNQWYAWPYLIPPATAAMYVANSHLKIMQSFVAAPQVHVSALKNPAMLGGPFIGYDASRVAEIRALMDKTLKEQAQALQLAQDIKTLDDLLLSEADGSSLEGLYRRIPDSLRGYVELVYDLHNHPSYRFIEALLYRSPHYRPEAQSITLSLVNSDGRAFVFSTPRLESADRVELRLPFSHEALDELFRMKESPAPVRQIADALGVRAGDEALFASLFTAEQPAPRAKYAGDAVRVRYFGHACILVETKDVSVLCDPVISYQYDAQTPRYTYADLPEVIDYILITHNHQDHCMFETLLQLRHKTRHVIVPRSNGGDLIDPSLKLILQTVGFRQVREIDELESIEVPGGVITSLPFLGEHADLDIRTKVAYAVKLAGRTIVCAADSNNIEPRLYENLRPLIGAVDILFLGMECEGAPLSWLYGALLTKPLARRLDQSRRFDGSDYEKGRQIVDLLQPQQVYVYAMGQEPWLTYLTSITYTEQSRPIVESNKLVATCQSRGLTSERLYGHKEIFLT
jgi:L-ascorbate metabolism protein UlaG (beta-lactamase superfamily)